MTLLSIYGVNSYSVVIYTQLINFHISMKPLKRVTYIFEFILAAHMVFSLVVEIQSVIFPVHLLADMLERQPHQSQKPTNPHANHNELFDFISFFGFCIWLSLKYMVEGFRFNTIIICAAELFFFLDRAIQYADKVMCQVSVVLTIMYILTLVSYPVYEFPEPTGQHHVGYLSYRLEDSYHTKVAVFYPTDDPVKQGLTEVQITRLTKKIQWSPDNKMTKQIYEYIVSRQWVPFPEWIIDFTIGHVYSSKFSCLLNATLIKSDEDAHPIMIISHGLSAHLHSYASYAKQWASEGYIVLCPQHQEMVYPWDALSTKIYSAGNKPEILEKYKKIRGIHLEWRTEQIRSLIDHISVKAKFSEIFNQECAARDITIWGHSFGGATAIRMAQIDTRVKGIISIDPWLFPMSKEILETPLNVPALFVYKELDSSKDDLHTKSDIKLMNESNSNFRDTYLAFKLIGMDHAHPTDLSFLIPAEMVFSQQLRTSDNLLLIHSSVCQLTSLFLTNYVLHKPTQANRNDDLIESFNEWAKAKWRRPKLLIDYN